VRNYLHEDFPHKALPLEVPVDQLLKPRKSACIDSACSSDLIRTVTINNSPNLFKMKQTLYDSEEYCVYVMSCSWYINIDISEEYAASFPSTLKTVTFIVTTVRTSNFTFL
jgi:hypothetical protein